MKPYRWIWMLMVLLVACAAPPTGETPVTATPAALPSPSPTESPLGLPPRNDSPLAIPDPASERLVGQGYVAEALRPRVAEALSMEVSDLRMLKMEPVIWSDASLGCPQPGMAYAQVMTPGWHAVYEDADGQQYNVHLAEDPESFFICENAEPMRSVP